MPSLMLPTISARRAPMSFARPELPVWPPTHAAERSSRARWPAVLFRTARAGRL